LASCTHTGCGTPRQRRCFARGAPLTEVGLVLRHRRTLTTAIYAKLDRDALQVLARPWPQPWPNSNAGDR